ncbi:MAG: DNA sulfur modification protein DndE [Microcoleus sp. T1-bin1]|nr:DNA sulfur modification protein DndE [Microcoleus sp. T1-bin1]
MVSSALICVNQPSSAVKNIKLMAPVDRIRLSQTGKDQLSKLKRSTKIDQWNILCRWGFCRSLAEPSIPSPVPIPSDSNVELSWDVFGGDMADILIIALKQRCHQDNLGTEKETLAKQFRLHLHRGIGYLAGDPNIKKIEDLVAIALSPEKLRN